jgi:hypothetical protein
VIRVAQRGVDNFLDRPFTNLTSLDFSNAFNTVDRREVAWRLHRFAPSPYRAGKWGYRTPSDFILTNRETGATHSLSSAQAVRQGDPLGPRLFSWYSSAPGQPRIDPWSPTAHSSLLDDIYILSNDHSPLEHVRAFFAVRQPSIQLNMAKRKTTTLQEARTTGCSFLMYWTHSGERELPRGKNCCRGSSAWQTGRLASPTCAVILLQRLQHNLRHLKRSLRPDDLEHPCERLDAPLANSVPRIRAAAFLAPS